VAERPCNLVAVAFKVAVLAIGGLEYPCYFFGYAGFFGYTEFHLAAFSFSCQNYVKGIRYYFDVLALSPVFNLSVCIFISLFFWLDPKETKGQG